MRLPNKHEQDSATANPAVVGDEPRSFDWDRIADSPDFRELVATRRRFVTIWVVFWVALFFVYSLLTIYADDFMSSSVYESVKVGYVIATTVLIGSLVMPWTIARHGKRVEPLVRRVREQAEHAASVPVGVAGGATGSAR
jgi:uncharacterized membrane protein (DUF485 family)